MNPGFGFSPPELTRIKGSPGPPADTDPKATQYREQLMRFRSRVLVTGLLTLGAMPFAAQADASTRAADACIQAFVDTYLPKDRQVKVRKLPHSPNVLGVYSKRYTIDLSARVSRDEIVNARCVASPSGQVLVLDGEYSNAPANIAQVTGQK